MKENTQAEPDSRSLSGRERQIVDYLKEHNLVTVEELVDVTGVSAATVRRDLIRLSESGTVYRVHGGVTLNRLRPSQPTTIEKASRHHEEKLAIARAAASLVRPGDSVIFDAGTTTIEIARLCRDLQLQVITPDLHIGLLLADRQKKIHDDLQGAQTDKEEAARLKTEYEEKLRNAEKEAEEILAQARQKSDSVLKALRRLQFEGFRQVAVQTLQSIPGDEYGEVRAVLDEVAASSSLRLELGTPLLHDEADVEAAALAVLAHLPVERTPDEDVVLMGHGARHPAVSRYEALARAVRAHDAHIHVGAMSGPLELEALLPRLSSRRVWLLPLLSVVGRHALEDMAGEAETSWRARLERAGHLCCPILRGMAEYNGFAAIWLRHLSRAAARLDA